MFSKKKKIINSKYGKKSIELKNYVENGDIYNSKFLYILSKLPSIGTYKIPKIFEYRIDLISEDLYKSSYMTELLLLYNGITIDNLKVNTILRVPSESMILNLKTKISTITCPDLYIKNLNSGNIVN